MKKMERTIRKNRRMDIERRVCLCGTPDTCIAQCMGNMVDLQARAGATAEASASNVA